MIINYLNFKLCKMVLKTMQKCPCIQRNLAALLYHENLCGISAASIYKTHF